MSENESMWEPSDIGAQCEVVLTNPTRLCLKPAGWARLDRWPFLALPVPAVIEETGPLFVCDEHKVEPQPPSYEEWLELQAVSE